MACQLTSVTVDYKKNEEDTLMETTKKAGMSDAQADAIAAVVIVTIVVSAAVYWVATAV